MDAKTTTIYSLLSASERHYIIPVYQRNYNWDKEQCDRLFEDLTSLIGNDREHFFGSIVLHRGKFDDYTVIDGQQRLTTVSLMCMAMYKLYQEKKKAANPTQAEYIRNMFCFKSSSDQSLQPHIVHVEKDRMPYWALIEGDEQKYVVESNITINFRHLYRRILSSPYSLEELYQATKRLMVARIALENGDNAQEIFESLNSTGKPLSDGDKIRNLLLMDLEDSQQRQYYNDYWLEIEKNSNYTGEKQKEVSAVSDFIRDYITAIDFKIPNKGKVYAEFKLYRNRSEKDTKDLLGELRKYSKYLFVLENAKTSSVNLNRILERLSLLGMSVLHPFELRIIDDFFKEKIKEKEICEIFELVENFVFRRFMVDVPTNALNKLFATLYKNACEKSEEANIGLYDATAYLLTSKSGNLRFPDDDEFRESWATKDIYNSRRNKEYIFLCLNGGRSPEGDTSVIKKMCDNVLTIEHIMPRTLNKDWQTSLGGKEEAERIQSQWLDNIANLTLSAYNPQYSNSNFQEKLNRKNEKGEIIGYLKSPLIINDYVKKQSQWGEAQLEERLRLIQDEAISSIWRMPIVKYKPDLDLTDDLTLDSDCNEFTDKKFLYGTINGKNIEGADKGDWKTVFKKIVSALDELYHYELTQIAAKGESSRLQNEENKDNLSSPIVNGLYAKINRSASELIKCLQNIFNDLGLDLDSVSFHVIKKQKRKKQVIVD